MTEKFVKSLSGHSGCIINLMQDASGGFFVRKMSGTADYNPRLQIQMAKQANFKSDHFYTPKVLGNATNKDGLFYFDMEYLNCQTLAHYMHDITLQEIIEIIDGFKIPKSCLKSDTNNIFQDKIKSLQLKITDNALYVSALERLAHFDFSGVPYSACHGDLTLENILVDYKNSKLYLIDFLDSFFDSWMIDVAKLLQDLELGWSYRYEKQTSNLEIRLFVAKQTLLDKILAMPHGQIKMREIYHILLLNVMRIVPYAHDDITQDFLEKSVIKINNILDTKEQKR